MADINKRGPDCDDCEGERGERGHRGHRGPRGNDGPPGPAGPSIPLTTIVFRPGDPAGSRGNVYVTWDETYAALQAVQESGLVYLEFDTRFSLTVEPSTGIQSCVVPPGVWNMNNVVWTHTLRSPDQPNRTFVELADGAAIVFSGAFNTLRILGWNLTVFSNRTGPIAPFTDIFIILDGTHAQLRNTLLVPGALPIWEITDFAGLTIAGSNSQGGLGGGGLSGNGPSVAPLVNVAVGAFFPVQGGAGFIKDNALTGGGEVFIQANDDNFNGRSNSGEDFKFPAFTGALTRETDHRDRWFIDPVVVTAADSPWDAFLNELVRADTTSGPAPIVNAPQATAGTRGERFSVIDYTGGAFALNPIFIQSTFGDIIDSPSISVANQCKTWVSDGAGRWMLYATS